MNIRCSINNKTYEADVEPRLLLVHYLRDQLNLTGTHIGCDTGHCGACTVMINEKTAKSCMVLAVQINGEQITTVEGLVHDSGYYEIQKAFCENHALQCGYCTPGMIMSTLFLIKRNNRPSEEEIRTGIEGNLCMCTGYVNIIKAIRAVSQTRQSGN